MLPPSNQFPSPPMARIHARCRSCCSSHAAKPKEKKGTGRPRRVIIVHPNQPRIKRCQRRKPISTRMRGGRHCPKIQHRSRRDNIPSHGVMMMMMMMLLAECLPYFNDELLRAPVHHPKHRKGPTSHIRKLPPLQPKQRSAGNDHGQRARARLGAAALAAAAAVLGAVAAVLVEAAGTAAR